MRFAMAQAYIKGSLEKVLNITHLRYSFKDLLHNTDHRHAAEVETATRSSDAAWLTQKQKLKNDFTVLLSFVKGRVIQPYLFPFSR